MSTESKTAAPGGAYRYYVLAMLVAVYTFNFLDRQILGILATPIKAAFSLTDTQFGLMSGLAFALLYTTLGIPVALLADRFSRSWIMTIAFALWSGFTALCGLATSFTSLFLMRVGVGIGEAGGAAPAYSLISDYFPPSQRGRALAAFAFGIPVGTAAGTLVGGLVAARFGWQWAFIGVGLAGLCLAPIFKLTVKDPPRGGQDSTAAPVAAAPLREVFGAILHKPSFWLLSFGAAASSVCGYGIAAWLPSFFQRSFHLSLTHTAWYSAGITIIGGLLGIWAGGMVADRLGAKSKRAYPLTPALAFVIAVPLFLAAMNSGPLLAAVSGSSSGPGGLILGFALFLIPTGLNLAWIGPITATVQHLVKPHMRATASAMFLLINNLLGIAGGTYYFGFMSDQLAPIFGSESLRWSIYTGMGFYLLSATLFVLASRHLEKDWQD